MADINPDTARQLLDTRITASDTATA